MNGEGMILYKVYLNYLKLITHRITRDYKYNSKWRVYIATTYFYHFGTTILNTFICNQYLMHEPTNLTSIFNRSLEFSSSIIIIVYKSIPCLKTFFLWKSKFKVDKFLDINRNCIFFRIALFSRNENYFLFFLYI